MTSPLAAAAAPLARRTAAGIVVDERLVRVACRWADLASKDGERVDVEWAGQAGCVDTPADRQLLAERLLSDQTTVPAGALERLFADEVRPGVARFVATHDAAALTDGTLDAAFAAALETEAKRAAFAAGLRVTGPFRLSTDSPSLRRARDAERARKHLNSIAADAASGDAAIAELAGALADGCDAVRVARVARAAGRVGPLDLLRAVSRADARWSAAAPTLWLAVGDRLVGVDPTRPDLTREPIAVTGVGPIRSVRGATIDGRPHLLAGGRGGVAILDAQDGRPVRTFAAPGGGGEFGFNAVCFLPDSRVLLATHSAHGLVRWRFDEPDRPAERIDTGPRGARALVAIDDAHAVLLDGDGRLLRVAGTGSATLIGSAGATIVELASLDDRRIAIADGDRYVAVLDPHDGTVLARTRVATAVCAVAAVDLCGTARLLVSGDDGSLSLVDPATGQSATVADARWPARAVAGRPGFVALLGVDRMRVALIDLARPDAFAADLHVAATFDKRAADVAFA